MTFIKRNKIIHARLKSTESKSGYVSVTTKATTVAAAKQRIKDSGLDKIEAAAQTHRLTQEGVTRILAGRRITIERAIEAWAKSIKDIYRSERTIKNSVEVVHRWASDSGLLPSAPLAVTSKHVGDWLNSKTKAKASTRRLNQSILGTFLKYCTAVGWNMGNQADPQLVSLDMNALTHEQKESKQRQAFTAKEVATLLRELDDTFWPFAVRLGFETGLRLGDICQLEWSCFDREGEVIVWTDKRNNRVAVPISEELSHLLTCIPVTDARFLFPEQRATILDPDRRAALSVQFKRLCERAEIPDKTFHCLRHTFTETHRHMGQTWDEIALALGHSCEETTKGYATKKVGGRKKD